MVDHQISKTYDHQISQVGTSRGVYSNEINKADVGDTMTLGSQNKFKTYFQYQIAFDH